MDRINRVDAQLDWDRELRSRKWERAKIRLAMFDYDPRIHGPISYRPSPAWQTIVVGDSADRESYETVKRSLLKQGERFSDLGAASGESLPRTPILVHVPCELDSATVFDSIASVMDTVHPRVVTQEQILRSALIAHLPPDATQKIGTPFSSIHPERATPGQYQQTGTRLLRARFDLAFGHVEDNQGITGVVELKAGNASFDTELRANFEKGLRLLHGPNIRLKR